jgi:hypothetical protein
MFIPTTLENVRALYPEALDVAVLILRQSRSKRNREPLVALEWGFEVAVTAVSFADIASGDAVQRRTFDELSIDEKLREYESRCWVTIVGRFYGRVCLQSERLDKVPAMVLDLQRRQYVAQEHEKRRAAGLSTEQRQKELEPAVGQLGR